MKDGMRFVDCDMHIMEPVDLFDRYLDREFRDRVTLPVGADGKPKANYKGFNARWKEKQKHNRKGELKASKEWMFKWQKNEDSIHGTNTNHTKGKNPGDVFHINTRPFPKAHFAVYPVDLPLKF